MTPAKRSIDDREWLVKHLTPLMKTGRDIQARDSSLPSHLPTYDKGYWTALKLILIRYYMPGFLNILAPKMKVAYIDLFAGPGLNLIGDAQIPVPGSPLLPWTTEGTAHQFNSVILCEQRDEYADALETRLAYYDTLDRSYILRGDANEFVDQLPSLLDEREIKHSLVFIDPEGMEFKFASLERFLHSIDCDVVVNFPSAGLTRNLTATDSATIATVRSFLGLNEAERLPPDEETALALYRSKLAGLSKDVSTEIAIRAEGSPFHYHLIPAVKLTRGGSPFFSILLGAKERIDRLKSDTVRIIAAQVEGKQGTLDGGFE